MEIIMDTNCGQWTLSTDLPKSLPLTLRDLLGRRIRVVPHGGFITLEFIPGRVTVYLDEAGFVKDVVVEGCQ
jgi:hypothetical protein